MRFLTPAGLALILAGALLIAFARQLGALYEGGNVTMSDLGFIVYGMILAAAGAVVLVIVLAVRLWRKNKP
jgi:hypothetical protein